MRRPWAVLLPVIAVLSACGGKGGGGGNDNCPEGHRPEGQTCVPIFDDCPSPAEIPVLGGGCRAVGVTACAAGFVPDGQGGCDAVLPTESCPPGTMEVIGQTSCQPVGVPECATGFAPDGAGGCDAILPSDPCPFGTMEALGHTDCRSIGDCGAGPWGNIPTDATTVFVDQSADATGADGSDASPFTTIADALAVVGPGGQIAVAAGDYEERLSINKPVRLAGRCAEQVTVRGTFHLGQNRPPVTVVSAGSGTTIRGVTLTGDAEGLVVNGAGPVELERAQVYQTGQTGIELRNDAALNLSEVAVVQCRLAGIASLGSRVSVRGSVVRDTADVQGEGGEAIFALCGSDADTCGNVDVADSLFSSNRWYGIHAVGVDTVVTSSVIRDTVPDSDGILGRGIQSGCDSTLRVCPTLTVAGSLVAGNTELGIFSIGSRTSIESTVVRDTHPRPMDGLGGVGIHAECRAALAECGTLAVADSLVAGNGSTGIETWGVEVDVISTIVRDTVPTGEYTTGRGIHTQCDLDLATCGRLTVTGCLVEQSTESGISVMGTDATIASTVVRDSQPGGHSNDGRGIMVQCDYPVPACGSLDVTGCLVEGNRGLGINVWNVAAVVESTVVRNTQPDAQGQAGRGIDVDCDPSMDPCPPMTIRDSLVQANSEVGIFAAGVDLSLASTAVLGIQNEADGTGGDGVHVRCYPGSRCGSLSAENCRIDSSARAGVSSSGVPAVLDGVIVANTRPGGRAPFVDDFGQGVVAMCDETTGNCGALQMTFCLVESSHTAAVAVKGVGGLIDSSSVHLVAPRPLDDGFGYGVQVEGLQSPNQVTFDIHACRIQDASLAGILFFRSGGTVSSSEVAGGLFSIVMNEGSSPTIGDYNFLSATAQSDPTWANMDPSPAPPPALPLGSPGQ